MTLDKEIAKFLHKRKMPEEMNSLNLTSPDSPMWLKAAEKFGFPVVSTVFLSVVLIWIAKWAADEVAEPLTRTHIGFVDSVKNNVEKQTQVLEAILAEEKKSIQIGNKNTSILEENQEYLRVQSRDLAEALKRSDP